ncbi:MAG: MBL fold metallo-hydrolase [Desulfobacula sp.]|nr:MBL fold metallo-hydrolase [Desulfobacula sp.]
MGLIEIKQAIKKNLKNNTMSLITLNVGDGDAIIIRFPKQRGEDVSCAVIDCYNAKKTYGALKSLGAKKIHFICATHPHSDHTLGMKKLIETCLADGIEIKQFWDSGFRHVSKIHYNLVRLLQKHPEINVIFPTSGYETIINKVRVQVLSPSIQLKNRYDTFGTNINNASIVLKFEYPPKDIAPYYQTSDNNFDKFQAHEHKLKQHSIILGGDAQFDAWARITEDFPELKKTGNRGQMIDPDTIEHKPLRCQVLKIPHHMSKHGISLEVLEALHPRYTITSCANKSRHGFPHELTVMAVNDVRRKEKNVMWFTGHHMADKRAGSIVTLFNPKRVRPLIYGLGEPASKTAPLPILE